MDIVALIAAINGPMLVALGWLFYNIRNINKRLEDILSEDKVRNLVADKLAVLETKQRVLEKRLDRLDNKLDLILDALRHIK